MKLSKKLLLLSSLPILLTAAVYFLMVMLPKTPNLSPISENNKYRQNLERAMDFANIKPQKITPREFINEIEFYFDDKLVIFSTQKDPFWQVSSLQDILKIAKINHQIIKFIDLSSAHPYATTL